MLEDLPGLGVQGAERLVGEQDLGQAGERPGQGGALDAQSREILQHELQSVWLETRNTFVFVTHNVREAVFLADRVVLMSARPGTLVAEHRISSPRPRAFEDVLLAKVVVDIHDHLLKEVDRTVAAEANAQPDLA